jgi:hypothetical protein
MTNVNPFMLLGMLAAGIGIAWAVTREGDAQASTSKPTWRWAATNNTVDGEAGIFEVWIEEPGKPAYPLGGPAGTDFQSYAQAKVAAIAYITARGATPIEKVV